MASFKAYPAAETAIQALFLFQQEYGGSGGNEDLPGLAQVGAEGLAAVREFARAVPMVKLLRVITRNMGYLTHEIGGGEDWHPLLRRYWEQQVESNINGFTFHRRRDRVLADARNYFQTDGYSPMRYYVDDLFSEFGGVKYELATAVASAFVTQVLQIEMVRTLKVFLGDGEFYKPQNRRDFAESFEGLQGSREALLEFDGDMSSDGTFGRLIAEAATSTRSESERIEKVKAVLARADEIALGLCVTAKNHLTLLIAVMKGLLFGESGGKYDTLSNISYIGGIDNERLIARLAQVLKRSEEGARIIGEAIELEKTSS